MKKSFTLCCLILLLGNSLSFAGLPDTGQTKCYDNTQEITCPQPGEPFYGQDAQYGPNLQSFSDLGDGIVRDNVTGLEWQQATAPGTYTWQQAIDYCEGLSLGGHDDWRLPKIEELSNLIDSSIPSPGPTINTTFFPDTQASKYWSSTYRPFSSPIPLFTGSALILNFGYGSAAWNYFSYGDVVYYCYVRAVRAGGSLGSHVDNGDGTVSDIKTGLMWQQATAPGYYTWGQALAYCENLTLAGYSDWRLPNRNELQSLYLRSGSIHFYGYPEMRFAAYWSSTTVARSPGGAGAWAVEFTFIYPTSVYEIMSKEGEEVYHMYVHAVRGGALQDSDTDGVYDDGDNSSIVGDTPCASCETELCDDNCYVMPNGPYMGTCVKITGGVLIGTGVVCYGLEDCNEDELCDMDQLDINANGIGDACECYADCNHDGKVNTTDLGIMKTEFFRTNCATVPCQADLNGDNKVNTSDLGIMKVQFFKTGCPVP